MKKSLGISFAASLLLVIVLRWQGSSLKTIESPRGIIDLELAGTPERVHQLLTLWSGPAVSGNIWLDFLFIVAYVMFLSIAAAYCALKWEPGIMQQAGVVLIRVVYVVGVLDIAENLLMLQTLAGHFTAGSIQLTYYCASIKFILAAIILLYLLVSLPVVFRKK